MSSFMLICLYLMTAQCEVQDFIWLVTLPAVDIVEHEYKWIELNIQIGDLWSFLTSIMAVETEQFSETLILNWTSLWMIAHI
jgi:hypothetical protein